jgi:NAD(P)-dependent dehydrogenase (short-subunit alcohol dehydrogenase family)
MSESFLEGRVAWITGGATGIGLAVARALAEAGVDVAVGSLSTASSLGSDAYATQPSDSEIRRASESLEQLGVRAFARGFDLRDDASVEAFHVAAVEALGPVDILVNAAGVCAQASVTEMSSETWATVLDINLNGPYRTIKRCLPGMLDRGWGRIVNIASTAANVGHPGHAAYCASKAGLLGLTRCVALEGAAHGVSCNAINPGSVETGLTRLGSERRVRQGRQGATVEENFEQIAMGVPQKRLIQPEEIGALAVFLCRDEALGLTMEDITLSAGSHW